MTAIFLSYRRHDASGHAGRLYYRLTERFGHASVFKDLASTQPGADFVEVIEETLARCDVLVAVIGPHWLGEREDGTRRLDESQDWVRIEVGQALERQIRVVPVLVAGAAMPSAADLPDEIQPLARRQAFELSEMSWDAQVDVLMESLAIGVAGASVSSPPTGRTVPSVWNVPSVPARFEGREDLLEGLAVQLRESGPAALVQAVHGLGGVGKSRLAIEYARRHARDYDVVWWVRAEQASTRRGDFGALAEPLGLPRLGKPTQDAVVVQVKRWLETHGRWLIMFDNAPDPGALENLLPERGSGHVLITSRHEGGWRGMAKPFSVDVWSAEESVRFLLKRAGDDDRDAARAIADALGNLPLALEQAGAYADAHRVSLAGYAQRLQDLEHLGAQRPGRLRLRRRATRPDTSPIPEHGPSGGYEHTVATTWELAFRTIESDRDAAAVVSCCAFLGPERIPIALLASDRVARRSFSGTAGRRRFDEALRASRSFSLLTGDDEEVNMHRLVQQVARARLSRRDQRKWSTCAEDLVADAFPENSADPATWPECARLLPHSLRVTEHSRNLDNERDTTGTLLTITAIYLSGLGEVEAAVELHRQAVAIFERKHGPDHEYVAMTLGNLGNALGELREWDAAQDALQRALKIEERIHGPGHPTIALTLRNLGSVLRGRGDPTAAKDAHQRALTILERAPVPDTEIAITLDNLGNALRDLEDSRSAVNLHRRALSIFERTYGSDNLQVAITLDNLGASLDDPAAALELHQRALAIKREAYGPDHDEVARTHYYLGIALRRLGDEAAARAALEEALTIFSHAGGPEHPDAMKARSALDSYATEN